MLKEMLEKNYYKKDAIKMIDQKITELSCGDDREKNHNTIITLIDLKRCIDCDEFEKFRLV
jgi:hypothetical protein